MAAAVAGGEKCMQQKMFVRQLTSINLTLRNSTEHYDTHLI